MNETRNKRWLVLLLFLLEVAIAFPNFTPGLKDIGAFDEASYVEFGRNFGLHQLPVLNEYPLVGLFFKLTYIPVHHLDFWMVYSCGIGRFLLLALLLLACYNIAKECSFIPEPLVLLGLFILSPAPILLTQNGSHALFTVMAAFALGRVLSFYRKQSMRDLQVASVFVGLAILSRMGEGLLLFGSLLLLSLALGKYGGHLRAFSSAALPCVIVVGAYLLACYASTGKSPLGTGAYLYAAFEEGHGLAYADEYGKSDFYVEGEVEARRIFGTPEQNHYSIVTAIGRNPTAYIKRIPRLAREMVRGALLMYGGVLSLWFFMLALYGCIDLFRKRHFMVLCILFLWVSYLSIYLVLVFQRSHLLLPLPIVLCLSSVGLTALVNASRQDKLVWSAFLFGLAVIFWARSFSMEFVYMSLILLVGLWIIWAVSNRFANREAAISAALVLLIASLLIFREGVPGRRASSLGSAPEEQAMLFLKRNFQEGTPIGAYIPNVPWAAKLKRESLVNRRSQIQSEQDLRRWIQETNLQAIYIEGKFRMNESALWTLIRAQIGKTMDSIFESDDQDIEVLRIRPVPQ